MKVKPIHIEGSSHLLLFFAGWGMDEHPFADIHPQGADEMICYDYRTLAFDDSLLQPYTRITVLAWSMGVWAATQVLTRHPEWPVDHCIAVNGTPLPIDETRGIAPAIFEGTLQGLNEATLQKFQRRMCGSAAEFKTFRAIAPQRPVEELKEELAAIGRQAQALAEETDAAQFPWDQAFIGQGDRIFLPENQERAWTGIAEYITFTEGAHYSAPLFRELIENLQYESL